MICIQLQYRAKVVPGQTLMLKDVARVSGPSDLGQLPLSCPQQTGIWKLQAITVAESVRNTYPDAPLMVLGADICYVHRVKAAHKDRTRPLRTASAFLILAIGGALGLAWFHADVDMPRAQFAVYEALTGQPPADPRLITIPYAIGVALGVSVFYALPARTATTPLEVKLTEYQEDMEKTEGRDMEDADA